MREETGIEIHTDSPGLRPIDPSLEFGNAVVTPLLFLTTKLRVTGMEIETVLSRNQREGFFQILPKFRRSSSLTGIVSRRGKAASGEVGGVVFKSPDIITLPAVKGNRYGCEVLDHLLGVDSMGGVGFLG